MVISYIIYNHTTIGINIRAAGCNENVAKTMGINVSKTLIIGGIIAGLFFGIAGVVKESVSIFTPAQGGLIISFHCVPATCSSTSCKGTFQKYQPYYCGTDQYIYYRCYLQRTDTLGVPSGTFQEFLLGSVVIIFAVFAQRGVKGVVK